MTRLLDSFRRTALGRLFGLPVAALPVDLFRALVGALSLFYFGALWRESADISAPDGLIDHALVQELFWFTRLGLFQPGIGAGAINALYLAACVGSLALLLGWRPKLAAGFLFVVAVSAFRWNFLVAYVEDAIVDLMLFWMLLLPIGRTLTVTDLGGGPRQAWRRWLAVRVPGTCVGFLILNIALIYAVAGAWKWTSPMWRDGTALYAVLKLPVSHAPGAWHTGHLPILSLLTWATLAIEPLAPVALILPHGHRARGVLLAGVIGLHLGIVATMRLPFANLACLGACGLVVALEWMASRDRTAAPAAASSGWRGRAAAVFVTVLALSVIRLPAATSTAPSPEAYDPIHRAIDSRAAGGLSSLHAWCYGALWCAGIAQEYQLLNWIDARNRVFRYEVTIDTGRMVSPLEPRDLFPDTNRSALLQAYLHGMHWLDIPPARLPQLEASLALRFAHRLCRMHPGLRGAVTVRSSIERIDPRRPGAVERELQVLFRFKAENGRATCVE